MPGSCVHATRCGAPDNAGRRPTRHRAFFRQDAQTRAGNFPGRTVIHTLEIEHMPTLSGHTSAIRATSVIGTNVHDASGRKIGEVEDIMLDKLSSNIMFAIISFGGFLGIAEKFHPVPWSALKFDKSKSSYVVEFTKEQLEAAPAGSIDELARNDGQDFRNRAFDYYKAPRYWETPRH
jgi:sporulation protein YlmC with PRC-barrel domain